MTELAGLGTTHALYAPNVHGSIGMALPGVEVRVAAFAYEGPDRLIRRAGDVFMCCSDYPHSEGTADPLGDYRRMSPAAAEPAQAPGLFGDNAAWLFRL